MISQLFNEPLFTRKGLIKFQKSFICNNVTTTYVAKVLFYTFPPKGNTFVSLFFIQFFIFFSRVFTKFISKSTYGINFFPKYSSHKSA